MVNQNKTKVEGGAKPKGMRFQKSTSNLKTSFKTPTTKLDDKVFDLGKQKHVAYFFVEL